jgi:hypothetical protein
MSCGADACLKGESFEMATANPATNSIEAKFVESLFQIAAWSDSLTIFLRSEIILATEPQMLC